MNAILSWMYAAKEKSATLVSDSLGADLVVEMNAEDHQTEGCSDVFFSINQYDKVFILIPSLSNFILICTRTN